MLPNGMMMQPLGKGLCQMIGGKVENVGIWGIELRWMRFAISVNIAYF